MPRLIDANEILKSEHQHYDYMADEYYVRVRDIENAPTVDAEPVRHGHWEWDGDYICSNCGERGHRNKWNYCPNCGAKMDESKEQTKGETKERE